MTAIAEMVRRTLNTLALWTTLVLTGCVDRHNDSALHPAGPQAAHIGWLWWQMLLVCAAVWLVVVLFMLVALGRRRTPDDHAPEIDSTVPRSVTRTILGGLAVTTVILFVFLVSSMVTDRRLMAIEDDDKALSITVTGRQWWWEVQYEDAIASNRLTTANEIHIPVGRPVRLKLLAGDVIHSFWVPSLHGKMDLIPGRENVAWIQADREGTYEGQCAEFCGYQHAHMHFLVIAESPDAYTKWAEAQRTSAREPTTPEQFRGREVFMKNTCVMCHAIRGTEAGGRTGPELTHLASRETLAAAAIPNTRGYLAGWILDPQQIKPGARMPAQALPPEDIHALLDYLESLQ